jgi:hypothetical protein
VSAENFDNTLRSYLNHRPFQSFLVEMEGGQTVLIEETNHVAFVGGGASYIRDGEIILIDCEEVKSIQFIAQKAG